MDNGFFTIVGIVIFLGFFLYIIVKSMMLNGKIIEGLTNATSDANTSATTAAVVSQNAGSGAANYASKVNIAYSQLKDQMNIPKYRSDYENVILQLDDYVSMLTLQSIMSMDPNAITDTSANALINRLSMFTNARSGLDNLMKYIDGVT